MLNSIKDRIKSLEKENSLLTDNLVDAIWVIDSETMRYEYSAPAGDTLNGYTAEELIGKSIFDELTPESSKKATALLRQELKRYDPDKHQARALELEMVHRDGSKYWVEIRAKLLEDTGSSLKIVGITRDITSKKRDEQQLVHLNHRLTEALADKERLLAEIKVLQALLPICSACKRIRDDEGKWWPLDMYVKAHTDSDFTHTVCPDCKEVMYADFLEST